MALEEPTVSELIRSVQSDVRGVAEDVRELKEHQALYVSKELYDTHRQGLLERITALENRGRQWWTAFALPAMVAALVLLIQEVIK